MEIQVRELVLTVLNSTTFFRLWITMLLLQTTEVIHGGIMSTIFPYWYGTPSHSTFITFAVQDMQIPLKM